MIELTQNFCNQTQSNVRKLNSLRIEHNRIFGSASVKYCTQIKSHLSSNKELLLTNKLRAGLNFKHNYIGQISERAETAENVKPSVKLTILDEMVIIEGYHRCSFAVGVDVKFIVEIGV